MFLFNFRNYEPFFHGLSIQKYTHEKVDEISLIAM